MEGASPHKLPTPLTLLTVLSLLTNLKLLVEDMSTYFASMLLLQRYGNMANMAL